MTNHSPTSPAESDYAASENPAIARCCDALERVRPKSDAGVRGVIYDHSDCAAAYRRAMPSLSGLDNIRDFIACAAHGMLIGAISATDGARLLYAAQVARGALSNSPAKAQK
ncbi:MAG: hypothetical protein WBE76_00455 [Terracidiphilus sp.]